MGTHTASRTSDNHLGDAHGCAGNAYPDCMSAPTVHSSLAGLVLFRPRARNTAHMSRTSEFNRNDPGIHGIASRI